VSDLERAGANLDAAEEQLAAFKAEALRWMESQPVGIVATPTSPMFG
jgi:hypothetical protein